MLRSAGPVSDISGPSTYGFLVKSVGLVATAAVAASAGPYGLILPLTTILQMEGAGGQSAGVSGVCASSVMCSA